MKSMRVRQASIVMATNRFASQTTSLAGEDAFEEFVYEGTVLRGRPRIRGGGGGQCPYRIGCYRRAHVVNHAESAQELETHDLRRFVSSPALSPLRSCLTGNLETRERLDAW